jgi:hypothetical protein
MKSLEVGMKVMLEQLELSWWSFHLRLMDESRFVRRLLPALREIWEDPREAVWTLAWALLGFPLGLAAAYLSSLVP